MYGRDDIEKVVTGKMAKDLPGTKGRVSMLSEVDRSDRGDSVDSDRGMSERQGDETTVFEQEATSRCVCLECG